MVRTFMCIIVTVGLFVLFALTYRSPIEQVKEEPAIDMGIWSETNKGNSLAEK